MALRSPENEPKKKFLSEASLFYGGELFVGSRECTHTTHKRNEILHHLFDAFEKCFDEPFYVRPHDHKGVAFITVTLVNDMMSFPPLHGGVHVMEGNFQMPLLGRRSFLFYLRNGFIKG